MHMCYATPLSAWYVATIAASRVSCKEMSRRKFSDNRAVADYRERIEKGGDNAQSR